MRVIRPAADGRRRRRAIAVAAAMAVTGALAAALALVAGSASPAVVGTLAMVAAIGLGVGGAWLLRIVAPGRSRSAGALLERLLGPTFDDSYALVIGPRLPIRDGARLDGLLIGPAGARALTVRDWEGSYRVRGRRWEFDAGGRRGWIRCRTNPGWDASGLAVGVARWAAQTGLGNVPVRGVAVFPLSRTRITLEEPEDEIVTSDNAPWWANAIGRARHLDPVTAATMLTAVLDASEALSRPVDDHGAEPRPA
ncbi:MAG: hypothetical protein K5924_00845 [Chloroflexi bacterium]|nr:hypothetical protein [Chloroflexota bacterium]